MVMIANNKLSTVHIFLHLVALLFLLFSLEKTLDHLASHIFGVVDFFLKIIKQEYFVC